MTKFSNIRIRRRWCFETISVLIFFFAVFAGNQLQSQSEYKSEADMTKAAGKFFDEGNHTQAMPLYSQLVSLYPKETEYNMKYGFCLLHADRNKAECLKYLKYAASKSDAPPIAYYYYGMALHANYEFSHAITNFKKFKEMAGARDVQKLAVDRQIEMCQNGKDLLVNIFDMNVLEKKEISIEEFFRIYELGEIGGKIIVKPDQFKSKLDLKKNEFSLIHLPSDARVIYYSGYGDNESSGKDIFRSRKTAGGDWGSPENIGSPVNTNFDEDFPFMHPDGTLYFASKGHNSMGGYDLFKSSYNESMNTWSKPENLNFAISSAFDDVLFISDISNQLAYFASSRATTDGKMNVYRIQISRKPFDLAFISGKFIPENQKEVKSAKITIYDIEENKKVGTYFTDKENGDYDIKLPKSGRTYKFVVETDENSPVHTGKVEIPEQNQLASLKQEIRLVGSGESEKLVIKNLFDESSGTAINEENKRALLRSASDLEVNSSINDVMKQINEQPLQPVSEKTLAEEVSVKEKYDALVSEMEKIAVELNQEVRDLRDQIAYGFRYSLDKAGKADKMYDNVEVTRQKMINEGDKGKKKALYDDLMAQRNALEPLASDAIVAYDFTSGLANEYDEKLSDREKMKSAVNKVKSGSGPRNTAEMQKAIDEYGPRVEDLKAMESMFSIIPRRYSELLRGSDEKLSKKEVRYRNLKSDVEALRQDLERLNKEISESKNKKEKEQLTGEKGAKEIDLDDVQYELRQMTKEYKTLRSENRNLKSDQKQLAEFISKLKSNRQVVAQLSTDETEELKELIEYFKEQRYIEDVIGEEFEAYIAGGKPKPAEASAQLYPAVDNEGKKVDYDKLYRANLSGIELIADGVKRNQELSDLYRNWAQTISEEKKIEQNHLEYTREGNEKAAIGQRIALLENKEREYRGKSDEYRDNALALMKSGESGKPGLKGGTASTGKRSAATHPTLAGNPGLSKVLVSSQVNIPSQNPSKSDINSAFQAKVQEVKSNSDKSTAGLVVAAVEINWAKTLLDLKRKKDADLENTNDEAQSQLLRSEIADLDKEYQKHIDAASEEFSEMEIMFMLDELVIRPREDLQVGFDPRLADDDHYENKYSDLIATTELNPQLNDVQKNRFLSEIHNYWAMTIQEELIFSSRRLKETASKDSVKIYQQRISELQRSKKTHIEQSNLYFDKFRSAQPEIMVASVSGQDRVATAAGEEGKTAVKEDQGPERSSKDKVAPKEAGESKIAGITPEEKGQAQVASKNVGQSYGSIRERRQSELQNTENLIDQKEVELDAAKSKVEKQQLNLSLALLNEQKKQEEVNIRELELKGDEKLLSVEGELELANGFVNWQENAENYVFSKKDFDQSTPENSGAVSDYLEAQKNYDRVRRLESEKAAMLGSNVVDKNAEAELMKIQRDINASKLKAYLALAGSNSKEYQANKRILDEFLASHPNLQKDNPKLWRRIQAANVIYRESEKYQSNAATFNSNSLKFDIYDQAQFMSEYAISEQRKMIEEIQASIASGELAFLAEKGGQKLSAGKSEEQQITEFRISREEYDKILEKQAFVEYEKDKLAISGLSEDEEKLTAEMSQGNRKIDALVAKRDSIMKSARNTKKKKIRSQLLKEAEVIDMQIAREQRKRDSLALARVQVSEREKVINQNSQRILRSVPEDEAYKIVLLAKARSKDIDPDLYISEVVVSPVEPETVSATESGETLTIVGEREFLEQGPVVPEKLESDRFLVAKRLDISPYSANKPIPVDASIPVGLIFKVQIGAYRNPIPQDLFKGFAPLMGERIPNGITRYTAGLFRDFGNANKAKNEIRNLGYSDAFVVAFVDGKRVSFRELQNLPDVDLTLPPAESRHALPDASVPGEVLSKPSRIDDKGQVSNAIAEQTINTFSVKDLFFTVQVGVYTNTVLPDKLKGINELNSELLDNGNIRYSTGQFRTAEPAQRRKEEMSRRGISDAFVTAYANGVRIGLSEGLKRLKGGQ